MEEIVKALGPWPVLQLLFGLSVLGIGVWAIIRGTDKHESPQQLEDKRAEWKALQQLENIEMNSFKQVELLSRIMDRLEHNADQMKGLAAALHNESQWPKGGR